MAQVSLNAIAAQLGRTSGQMNLSLLRPNGYTRTFAGSGYRRVNPFQVEVGTAPDPDVASSIHLLGDWLGYTQNAVSAGGSLANSSGYGEFDLTWSLPTGYSRAPAILNQRVYLKDTDETDINATSLSVDPFTSPDQTADAGDGTSDTVNVAAYEPNVVAIGLLCEFDDSVVIHESLGYAGAGGQDILIGAGTGIAAGVFSTNPGPVTCTQTTDPNTCSGGDPVNLQIQCNMQGPSTGTLQRSVNGGAFATIDSGVSAGTTVINRSETSGNNFRYRLRYNVISPDTWATQVGNTSAVCNLA